MTATVRPNSVTATTTDPEVLDIPDDLLEATQRLGTTSIRDLIAMIERPNLSVQEVQ